MQIFSFRISSNPFCINVQALKQHHWEIWVVVGGQCVMDFFISKTHKIWFWVIDLHEAYIFQAEWSVGNRTVWTLPELEHIISQLTIDWNPTDVGYTETGMLL